MKRALLVLGALAIVAAIVVVIVLLTQAARGTAAGSRALAAANGTAPHASMVMGPIFVNGVPQ